MIVVSVISTFVCIVCFFFLQIVLHIEVLI